MIDDRIAVTIRLLAVLDFQDPVVGGDEAAVVGDDHDGCARGFLEAAEDCVDLVAGLGVELAGRLVGEQDDWLFHEGTGDRHSLLLAAGELVGAVVQTVLEADLT